MQKANNSDLCVLANVYVQYVDLLAYVKQNKNKWRQKTFCLVHHSQCSQNLKINYTEINVKITRFTLGSKTVLTSCKLNIFL